MCLSLSYEYVILRDDLGDYMLSLNKDKTHCIIQNTS